MITLFGKHGMLGSELGRQLGSAAVTLDHAACDVTDPAQVERALRELRPSAVINATAYSQVDLAEDEREACWAVNARAVEHLADTCRALDCTLLHVSTDYVFGADDTRTTPYKEDDPPGPQGQYARSKLAGEQYAARWERHFIVRTCGLFGRPAEGRTERNFVDTMLRLAERPRLRVVDDQYCSPTYVPHLVRAMRFLVETQAYGTYHIVNSGHTSWYELAAEIFRQAGKPVQLERISTAEYAAAAPRPSYSVLDTGKYHRLGGPAMPEWQEGVREYLRGRGGA